MNRNRDLIALTIWWCEGSKIRRDYRWKNSYLYPIEVTNTDPKIINIFIKLLIERFNVPIERLKGQLQVHKGDDQEELEKYWSSQTGIPFIQFNKTIVRKNGTRKGKGIGTFKVRTYNKELFFKLRDELHNELKKLD